MQSKFMYIMTAQAPSRAYHGLLFRGGELIAVTLPRRTEREAHETASDTRREIITMECRA